MIDLLLTGGTVVDLKTGAVEAIAMLPGAVSDVGQ